jgi:hypothetical protein
MQTKRRWNESLSHTRPEWLRIIHRQQMNHTREESFLIIHEMSERAENVCSRTIRDSGSKQCGRGTKGDDKASVNFDDWKAPSRLIRTMWAGSDKTVIRISNFPSKLQFMTSLWYQRRKENNLSSSSTGSGRATFADNFPLSHRPSCWSAIYG